MDLPAEVLLNIIQYSYNDSSINNLVSCLGVCRRWHGMLISMLYRDIVLRDKNLLNVEKIPVVHRPLIQSITVCLAQRAIDDLPPNVLERTGLEDNDYLSGPFAEVFEVWNGLKNLTKMLPEMRNLSTFSFYMDLPLTHVPRPLLAAVIRALPDSCVSIEIDTDGLDDCQNRSKNVHLCVEFRKLLPRLHHLRLNVAMICCKLLEGERKLGGTETGDDFNLNIAPNLQTLVIHYPRQQHRVRAHINNSIHRLRNNCDTWSTEPVVRRLRSLLDHGTLPKIRTLIVVNEELHIPLNQQLLVGHRVKYVRNIIENTTWAVPMTRITGRDGLAPVLARLPNNEEVIGSLSHLAYTIEGNHWVETAIGSRLPAETIATRRNAVVEMTRSVPTLCRPIICTDWTERETCNAYALWDWEYDCNRTLLSAVKFEGLEETPPVFTVVPSGWSAQFDKLLPPGTFSLGG
ncbi:MAG: hypothetical protein MMC33_005476 [Icmadophila ericetorum]|nr:hypothetical protein [Icmadophila ericetorum]